MSSFRNNNMSTIQHYRSILPFQRLSWVVGVVLFESLAWEPWVFEVSMRVCTAHLRKMMVKMKEANRQESRMGCLDKDDSGPPRP
jgi:hypothetical protein